MTVVDPVFAHLAQAIYGDALDPRELWDLSKALDPADVNTPGGGAQKKKKKTHSKTGAALLLGTAAESDAAISAGRSAVKAAKGVDEMATAGKKVRALTMGRGALQATNLGVGLIAAHQLLKKPKQPVAKYAGRHQDPATKGKLGMKGLRPKKVIMNEAQKTEWAAVRSRASTNGTRVLLGATALTAGAIGHHIGSKSKSTVAKAFRVKPINAAQQTHVVTLKARRRPGPPPLAKSLSWAGEISKVDNDKRLVFGWCSLSAVDGKPVVDLQGDFVPLEEIEKSAYKYVIESRKGGDMHRRVSKLDVGDEPLHTADMVESFVVTPEKLRGMGLPEDALPHGWWVGFKVNDEEQWAMVKSGERAGFSIHGTGHRRAA